MTRKVKDSRKPGTTKKHIYRRRTLRGKPTRRHDGENTVRMKPEAEAGLHETFSRIGKPPTILFRPDRFQRDALEAVNKTDCLVTAPTGAGKTWIAEQAIARIYTGGGRCWYASPLKALTNAKWVEFTERFGQRKVGILTGDTKENVDAPIVVGTTEILRNQLYDAMHRGEDLDFDLVILDEAHFLGDRERGVVWEEIMIYLPARINLLLLSATIGNAGEIASWLESIRGKPCTIIEEKTRPVPLYPLFLHPSGRMMPLLSEKKLYRKIISFLDKEATIYRRGDPLPPFDDIIRVLRKFRLLPAIFFLKSRNECNVAVGTIKGTPSRKNKETFKDDFQTILAQFPYLKNHGQLGSLLNRRVGAHHGGQLPAWKFTVEMMMKKGYLDAVFATSTVAAGVNFPARSVVLLNSDQFNGHEFLPLNATEFHQMTGRAGRRGQDNIGFMIAIPQRYMDTAHLKNLYFMEPERIKSRIKNDFSMALNLLLSHTPDDIRNIFKRSLASFQERNKKRSKTGRDLWRDFQRHLMFLKDEGFVDENGHLTEKGMWTSQLRLDQPLLVAECIENKAFPRGDEALLAAAVAPFVYDRDANIVIRRRQQSKKMLAAYDTVISIIAPFVQRMTEAGFEVTPLPLWASVALYWWAKEVEWSFITKQLNVADGDLTMLISRTADNLHQIASLRATHREIAEWAARARSVILREPVVFE